MGITGPLPHQKEEIRKELRQLISSEYPDWKKRKYVSSRWIMAKLKESPAEYPLLSVIHPTTVSRWLNWYLKEHGRVPSNDKASKRTTWVLAGATV